MRRETKRSLRVSSGRPLHEADQFLLRKMEDEREISQDREDAWPG